jgi:hypothetical protein
VVEVEDSIVDMEEKILFQNNIQGLDIIHMNAKENFMIMIKEMQISLRDMKMKVKRMKIHL